MSEKVGDFSGAQSVNFYCKLFLQPFVNDLTFAVLIGFDEISLYFLTALPFLRVFPIV
jgi:hypothetical protein